MKKIFLLTAVSLLFILNPIFSQVEMGGWRTHFSYNTINQVCQSENKVFAVSEGSLFSIDKRDGGLEFYSKISGLNGTVVSQIGYDEKNEILLVTYEDGNIDFMSADGVKNLPDFAKKQLSADKSINHILIYNDKAYLSCSFGVMTLNMLKMEIQDTYYIGDNARDVEILQTIIANDKIYAISKDNIYFADVTNPQIINYEYWTKMTNLPGSGDINSLQFLGSKLVLLRNKKLYSLENDVWKPVDALLDFTKIKSNESLLLAFTDTIGYYYDKGLLNRNKILNIVGLNDGEVDLKKSNQFWLSGDPKGIAKYISTTTEPTVSFYKPNGPAVNLPYRMKFAGEKLFVLPGHKFGRLEYIPGNVMIFENNEWTNISQSEIESIVGNRVWDFSTISVDSDDNSHYYITSVNSGIYEFLDDKLFKHYNYTNSNIKKAANISDNNYQWVDNGVLDKDKNFWFTNDLTSEGIKVMLKNGEWVGLNYDGIDNKQTLGQILLNNENPNQKWVLAHVHGAGVCVFDDNGTIKDQSDDKSIFRKFFYYTANNEVRTIAPRYYYCIEQDKNGTIWVGTDEGPLLFTNTSDVFNNNYSCSRVIIPRNDGTDIGDFLLEKERIIAIAIDGANRKWVGTKSSGLYLLSENGQETIHHFTTENSPLTSNKILSIAINPNSGEVFVGTGSGLVSYQSDAAASNDEFKDVHVYPNPVRADFKGLITVTGLSENSSVKITDVAGNLVAETTSNGSIATWDGQNNYGQRVSTGVYLAICTSEDGSQSKTVKILVIN